MPLGESPGSKLGKYHEEAIYPECTGAQNEIGVLEWWNVDPIKGATIHRQKKWSTMAVVGNLTTRLSEFIIGCCGGYT
jgi:hypothetical protein